jgi:hypothetical protein
MPDILEPIQSCTRYVLVIMSSSGPGQSDRSRPSLRSLKRGPHSTCDSVAALQASRPSQQLFLGSKAAYSIYSRRLTQHYQLRSRAVYSHVSHSAPLNATSQRTNSMLLLLPRSTCVILGDIYHDSRERALAYCCPLDS